MKSFSFSFFLEMHNLKSSFLFLWVENESIEKNENQIKEFIKILDL